MKRTKIVATIGPASEKQTILERMIRAGMNVARLNISHGTWQWHGRAIRAIRAAAEKVGEPVAIMLDLQGPKARLGQLKVEGLKLKVGDRVVFTTDIRRQGLRRDGGLASRIPIAVPNFHKYVKRGSHLLIADGTIECAVERVVGRDIHARVVVGGELQSHKGIAIQGVSLPLPSLTTKDKRDLAWARRQDIDFVALSFVKRAADVKALRRMLGPHGAQIIVKIETREAVHHIGEILREADGIMIARGDLALATSAEEVPLIQKEIIEKCRRAAKPVIVATEMLGSMERSPRPTRAEASDVANAVIDHTDAMMLSGETATGRYPIEAVRTMARIIQKTETSRFDDLSIGAEIKHGGSEEEVAFLASVAARTTHAKAIVAGSLTGHTGRLLSRYRTEMPLFVGSPHLRVVHQLNLSWGLRPFLMPKLTRMDALLAALLLHARRSGLKKGDPVVFLGSRRLAPHAQSFVGVRTI